MGICESEGHRRLVVHGCIRITGLGGCADDAILDHRHGVGPGRQVPDEVGSAGVRYVGRLVGVLHAIVVEVKVDGDSRDGEFTGILRPVAISVIPNVVADGGIPRVAEIGGGEGLARVEGDGGGIGCARAIEVVARRGTERKIGDAERVAAREDAIDQVGPGAVGNVGWFAHIKDTVVIEVEVDPCSGEREFRGVLDAVAIDVPPDVVADRSEFDIHEVIARVAFARSEGDRDPVVGGAGIGRIVVRIGGVSISYQLEARGRGLHDHVVSGREVRKGVVARGIGGHGQAVGSAVGWIAIAIRVGVECQGDTCHRRVAIAVVVGVGEDGSGNIAAVAGDVVVLDFTVQGFPAVGEKGHGWLAREESGAAEPRLCSVGEHSSRDAEADGLVVPIGYKLADNHFPASEEVAVIVPVNPDHQPSTTGDGRSKCSRTGICGRRAGQPCVRIENDAIFICTVTVGESGHRAGHLSIRGGVAKVGSEASGGRCMAGSVFLDAGEVVGGGKVAEVEEGRLERKVHVLDTGTADRERLLHGKGRLGQIRDCRVVGGRGIQCRSREGRSVLADEHAVRAVDESIELVVTEGVGLGGTEQAVITVIKIDGEAGEFDLGVRSIGGAEDTSVIGDDASAEGVIPAEGKPEVEVIIQARGSGVGIASEWLHDSSGHREGGRSGRRGDTPSRVEGRFEGGEVVEGTAGTEVGSIDRDGPCAIRNIRQRPFTVEVCGDLIVCCTIGDGQRDVGDAGLSGIFETIAVEIEPDGVSDDHGRLVSEVGTGVGETRRQRDSGIGVIRGREGSEGGIGRRIGNSIPVRISRLGEARQHWAQTTVPANLNGVLTFRQSGEHVEADRLAGIAGIGDGGFDQRFSGIENSVAIGVRVEGNGDSTDSGFVPILGSVAVVVVEHRVSDRC